MQNVIDANLMTDLINWTASYRRDSTVPFPYYVVRPRAVTETDVRQPRDTLRNFAEGKTKQAAWFVSSSRDHNSRKGYVRELSRCVTEDVQFFCKPQFERCIHQAAIEVRE